MWSKTLGELKDSRRHEILTVSLPVSPSRRSKRTLGPCGGFQLDGEQRGQSTIHVMQSFMEDEQKEYVSSVAAFDALGTRSAHVQLSVSNM